MSFWHVSFNRYIKSDYEIFQSFSLANAALKENVNSVETPCGSLWLRKLVFLDMAILDKVSPLPQKRC